MLHEYSEDQTLEVVKLLISLGADVNAANDHGITALHGAGYKGANKTVQFLVDGSNFGSPIPLDSNNSALLTLSTPDDLSAGSHSIIAVYSGAVTNYQFTVDGAGLEHVTDMRAGAPDGSDSIKRSAPPASPP